MIPEDQELGIQLSHPDEALFIESPPSLHRQLLQGDKK